MKAIITKHQAVFTLELSWYPREWTNFLKQHGAVFKRGVWTLQIKHLEDIKSELERVTIPYKVNELVTPSFSSIPFDNMLLPPREYQKKAATFMANNPAFGCFDDCGLGKTITALSAIRGLDTKKNLIVAEIKALDQWCSEIKRFTGLTYTKIRGSPDERKGLWNALTPFMVVNYHLLLKDRSPFEMEWDTITFDEGSRYLRNRDTKLASCARHLNGKHKWVLTASPIENNLADIFSIYEVMDPTILGDWDDFKKKHVKTAMIPVSKYWNGREYVVKKVEKIVGYLNQEEIKRNISPYFIRRTPEEVGNELPELVVQDITLELKEPQRAVYDDLRGIVEDEAEHTDDIINLGSLVKLRRLCDSLGLIEGNDDVSSKLDEVMAIIYENRHRKIIVFSQWTDSLALLAKRLSDYKYTVVVGSGSKHKFDVDEDIDSFTKGDINILLSSDAGSRSLNLQASSMIINMDLPWNPQTIKQRIGRARRMGSEHQFVVVYNMIAKDTIEEGILPLLKTKLKLSDDFIDRNAYNYFKDISIEDFVKEEFKRKK